MAKVWPLRTLGLIAGQTLGRAKDRINAKAWTDLVDLPFDTVDPEAEHVYVQ